MRGPWLVVARGVALALGLAACHHADAPPPAAPKGPTACARAADVMVQLLLDHLAAKDAPPTETADAMRNLIRERCEQDGWSADATRCLIAMTSQDDAAACARLMTDDQQAALVRDEQAQFGGQGSPGAGPPGPGSPAPGAQTGGPPPARLP